MSRTRQDKIWLFLNQSQSPAFQDLVAKLACEFGHCRLITGMPFPVSPNMPLEIVPAPSYDRRGHGRRGVSWLKFVAFSILQFRPQRCRYLLVTTNPPFLPLVAWGLHRYFGTSYGLVVWDIYPDHLVSSGVLGQRHPVVRLWRSLNKAALLTASPVITLSDSMADALRTQAECVNLPVAVIPFWATTDSIYPRAKQSNSFAVEHGQVDQITVMYSGNLGASHDLDTMIEAAALLSNERNIHFMVIGGGLGEATVHRSIERHQLKNITCLKPQPWEMLPLTLSTGDIAVVAQTTESAHLSLPSKTFSILAAGCAVIAVTPSESDLWKMVSSQGIGDCCVPGDALAFASIVRRWLRDPEQLAKVRERSREVALTQYSEQAVHRKYINALSAVLEVVTDAH